MDGPDLAQGMRRKAASPVEVARAMPWRHEAGFAGNALESVRLNQSRAQHERSASHYGTAGGTEGRQTGSIGYRISERRRSSYDGVPLDPGKKRNEDNGLRRQHGDVCVSSDRDERRSPPIFAAAGCPFRSARTATPRHRRRSGRGADARRGARTGRSCFRRRRPSASGLLQCEPRQYRRARYRLARAPRPLPGPARRDRRRYRLAPALRHDIPGQSQRHRLHAGDPRRRGSGRSR